MIKILKYLVFCLPIIFVTSCNKDNGVVSLDEWNEAVEHITNVNKKYNLNYIASSDVAIFPTEDFDKIIIDKIEVNGDIQQETDTLIDEEEAETRVQKIVKDVGFSIIVNEEYTNPFVTTCCSDIFDMVLDLYGNQQYFTFNDSNKSYRCEEKYEESYSNFTVEVKFENKLFKSIYMDYQINGNEYTLKGTVNFEYNKSTLSLTNEEKNRFDNAYNASFTQDESVHKFIFGDSGSGYNYFPLHIRIFTKDIENRRKFFMKQEQSSTEKYIEMDPEKNSKLFFNDILLVRGNNADEGDYYFENINDTRENAILHFNRDISNGILKMEIECKFISGGHEITATISE